MTNRLPVIGDKVRDRITGVVGIVTTHASHLTGCDRMWISPCAGDDNKTIEGMWVDIDMLEIIEPAVIEKVTYARQAPGGVDLPPTR